MPTWTNATALKERMGLSNSDIPVLGSILDGIESSISGIIGSPVLEVERSYWLSATGTPWIVLPERPVQIATGTVYWVDQPYQTVSSDFLLEYQTDYTWGGQPSAMWGGSAYRGAPILEYLNGTWVNTWMRWPTRLANSLVPEQYVVRVVDVMIGWAQADIPSALTEAAYMEGAVRWRARKTGQIYQTESLNGYSYSLGSPSQSYQQTNGMFAGFMSDQAKALLTPYAMPVVAGVM